MVGSTCWRWCFVKSPVLPQRGNSIYLTTSTDYLFQSVAHQEAGCLLPSHGGKWFEHQVLPNDPVGPRRGFYSFLPKAPVVFDLFLLILLVSKGCKFKVCLYREGSYVYKRARIFLMKSGCDREQMSYRRSLTVIFCSQCMPAGQGLRATISVSLQKQSKQDVW